MIKNILHDNNYRVETNVFFSNLDFRYGTYFKFSLFHLLRNLHKLSIKYPTFPELRKIDPFEQKYALVTTLIIFL